MQSILSLSENQPGSCLFVLAHDQFPAVEYLPFAKLAEYVDTAKHVE